MYQGYSPLLVCVISTISVGLKITTMRLEAGILSENVVSVTVQITDCANSITVCVHHETATLLSLLLMHGQQLPKHRYDMHYKKITVFSPDLR